MRAVLRFSWIVLAMQAMLACEPDEPAARQETPSSPAVAHENPFATSDDRDAAFRKELCVLAVLEIKTPARNEPLQGSLELRNRCAYAVAVLTSPIQTRIHPQDAFHWEGMADPYARLHLYPRAAGRPRMLGDAGAQVHGLPEFVVIGANSTTKHALIGDASPKLDAGEYGAFFQSWAARTTLPPQAGVNIDLSKTVAVHNQKNSGQPRLARARDFKPVYSRDVFFKVD